jgi:hypothetical protein
VVFIPQDGITDIHHRENFKELIEYVIICVYQVFVVVIMSVMSAFFVSFCDPCKNVFFFYNPVLAVGLCVSL